MKRCYFLTILGLTTMLYGCGGGGGGHVPATTLPHTPSMTNSDVTCMQGTPSSNKEKREQLAKKAGSSDVDKAFENLQTFFGDNPQYKTESVSEDDLRKALVLAGFTEEIKDLKNLSALQDWVTKNFNKVKNKAGNIYRMYGKEKSVTLDNVRLAVVDIEAKQDSYVNFDVDSNGKIQGLYFDVDEDSVDARSGYFVKGEGGTFTRKGEQYIITYKLKGGENDFSLELWEDPHNMDFEIIKNMLLARLEEECTTSCEEDKSAIEKLTKFDDLKSKKDAKDGEAYWEKTKPSQVTYESIAQKYQKELAEDGLGLKYADFGIMKVEGEDGEGTVNETFVFAGGLDAKRKEKAEISGKMTFKGKAVAALIRQEYTDGSKRHERTKTYEGDAQLDFNNGREELNARFQQDGWYDVKVESNDGKNNYNIEFEGNPKDQDFAFNTPSVKDFVGEKTNSGKSYGAVDFGYYGESDPTEAAGYVAYGEHLKDGTDLHAQIGFGAYRQP